MQNRNVLAKLVDSVVDTRVTKNLDAEEQRDFHLEFESEIFQEVEDLRASRRRAYEDVKNIALS